MRCSGQARRLAELLCAAPEQSLLHDAALTGGPARVLAVSRDAIGISSTLWVVAAAILETGGRETAAVIAFLVAAVGIVLAARPRQP